MGNASNVNKNIMGNFVKTIVQKDAVTMAAKEILEIVCVARVVTMVITVLTAVDTVNKTIVISAMEVVRLANQATTGICVI